MADPTNDTINLWRSRSRALLSLDEPLVVPRSLRRWLHPDRFSIGLNQAFDTVLNGCASRPQSWINPELGRIYQQLHEAGWAHSVELWEGEFLAAGLLAIGIGSCWIGESMVHHRSNAGTVMLVRLIEALRSSGFTLFDVQLSNPHLARFGCREISDPAYMALLGQARSQPTTLRLGSASVCCEGWMRE